METEEIKKAYAASETEKSPHHELTKMSMLQAQVCSDGTWDEALEWLRKTNPSGTSNNWQKDERACVAPVVCASNPDRHHYVFDC
jgi:hypothetical protein